MFVKIRKEPENKRESSKKVLVRCGLVVAFALLAFAIEKISGTGKGTFFDVSKAISLVLYFASYLIAGHKIIVSAFANLFKNTILIDALIVTVGTLICILLGQYIGAIIAMTIYYIGNNLAKKEK